ncbi:MAG: hypothetical protein ACRC9R_05910 [Enterovibrio sp.]
MKLFRSKQRGIAVMWVVVSITTISGLLSFTLLNGTRDSTKKVQNQIQSERDRAALQSALHCAATIFETLLEAPKNNDVFNGCKFSSEISFSLEERGSDWLLSANKPPLTYSVLISPRAASIASFNSAGSLRFELGSGGGNWIAAPEHSIANKYACNMINLLGELHYNRIDGYAGLFHNANENCASDYQSKRKLMSETFKKDVRENNQDMQLFETVFGTTKSNWQQVKDKFDIVLITGTNPTDGSELASDIKQKINECGKAIKDAIAFGNRTIWVQGDCILDGLEVELPDPDEKSLVVIQDGIFAAYLPGECNKSNAECNTASSPKKVFNVSIYQFLTTLGKPDFSHNWGWRSQLKLPSCDNSISVSELSTICQGIASLPYANFAALPFYFVYSFGFTGSLIIDVPESVSLIPWFSNIGHDPDIGALAKAGGFAIKKGSFHDL